MRSSQFAELRPFPWIFVMIVAFFIIAIKLLQRLLSFNRCRLDMIDIDKQLIRSFWSHKIA